MLGAVEPEALLMRLFTNDRQPEDTDDVEDYVEATSYGYYSQPLDEAAWVLEGDTWSHPDVTFRFNGALGAIYGYYITQSNSHRLMWAQRFNAAPYVIRAVDDRIIVAPRMEVH